MMTGDANPLISAGLIGLGEMYQRGDVTPLEACEAFWARTMRLNSTLNIAVALDESGARTAASESAARWRDGAPKGPLDGAPIFVKANVAMRGLPWTAAMNAYRTRIAPADAAVVNRLRKAGAVILGLANMHEAALGAVTTSPLYGPCMNPLRTGYTPGGSSGGSAAAVAAGFCVGAIGTDTLGSVRIPSAYCGNVGFKPSAGRISRTGVFPLALSLDHIGVHARTVRDVECLLAALEGYDAQDAGSTKFYPTSNENSTHAPRLAWLEPAPVILEADVAQAYGLARAKLAQHHHIEAVGWGSVLPESVLRGGLLICESELLAQSGDELDAADAISDGLRSLLTYGAGQSAPRLAKAYAVRSGLSIWSREIFSRADILVTPTAPQTAFPHAAQAPQSQAYFTGFANFLGLPALTVPLPRREDELPAGLQLIAPHGADHMLLEIALAVENELGR